MMLLWMLETLPLYFHDDFEYEISTATSYTSSPPSHSSTSHEKWISRFILPFSFLSRSFYDLACSSVPLKTVKQERKSSCFKPAVAVAVSNSFFKFFMNTFPLWHHLSSEWKGWSGEITVRRRSGSRNDENLLFEVKSSGEIHEKCRMSRVGWSVRSAVKCWRHQVSHVSLKFSHYFFCAQQFIFATVAVVSAWPSLIFHSI